MNHLQYVYDLTMMSKPQTKATLRMRLLAALTLAVFFISGCDLSPSSAASSEAPMVTPAARISPPPAPERTLNISGAGLSPDGYYTLESTDAAYDGMRVKHTRSDSGHVFTLQIREDEYVVVLDVDRRSSKVIQNGEVVSISDPSGHRTFGPYDEARLSEVMRQSSQFLEHLQEEGAIDVSPRRAPVSLSSGGLGLVGLNTGVARRLASSTFPCFALASRTVGLMALLQVGGGYWYRGEGFSASANMSCYRATTDVNYQCSNSCCIGCVQLLPCDKPVCALSGTPYFCVSGRSGRSCGAGEGSCHGGGPGGGWGLDPIANPGS